MRTIKFYKIQYLLHHVSKRQMELLSTKRLEKQKPVKL